MVQNPSVSAQNQIQNVPASEPQQPMQDAMQPQNMQNTQNVPASQAQQPGQNVMQPQSAQSTQNVPVSDMPQPTQNMTPDQPAQNLQNVPASAGQQPMPDGIQTGQTAAQPQTAQVTDAQLLQALQSSLTESDGEQAQLVGRLAASRTIGRVAEAVMEKQWLLEPQDLSKPHSVNELYERMHTQIQRMEQVLQEAGSPAKAMLETVLDVKRNIDFMNQVNQMYQYVQIPLKLSGQNANSELYVFSNRRSGGSPDGTYRAFLHLELEHLGTTDVSVQLTDNKVSTHFYLEDEEALEIVAAHADELTKHLEQKGYQCTVQMESEHTPVDFVDDFLMDGKRVGSLSRYSFDMKA
jgi:hypothetical protein